MAHNHKPFHGKAVVSREAEGFTVYETVHAPGIRAPRHSHERGHLAFVLRGFFEEICDGKVLECRPNSILFLAPDLVHSDDFNKGAQCLLIELCPSRLNRLRDIMPLDEPIFRSEGMHHGWRLHNELWRTDTASPLAIEGIVMEMLADVVRDHEVSRCADPPQWLRRAKEIIHDRYDQRITHEEIAKEVSIHPVHLAAIFRRHYHHTIGDYVRRLRIERACEHLASSNVSLAEIALMSGFSDQSHFSKVFKNIVGSTPSSLRAHFGKS
jgi:AraC family transcriptional regulator